MGKWQWPTLRFPKLHLARIAFSLVVALLFAPASIKAQEAETQNTSDKTVFDGTYVIHLSEKTRVKASGRPEPGYFDSLAIELFTKAGLNVEIVPHMPWKRQMEVAQREVGQVIYPTTRIEHREDVFHWVGPVSRTFWNLFGFADRGWSEMSFETLLDVARIGVLMGSAREGYLRDRGAKQLVMVPREELLFPMMKANRVDLIAVGGNILRHYVGQETSQNPDTPMPEVTGIMPYRACYLYIAISGDVPDDDLVKLQTQLDTFKTNGFFVENRRLNGLSINPKSSFLKAMLNLDNNGVTCIDLDGE